MRVHSEELSTERGCRSRGMHGEFDNICLILPHPSSHFIKLSQVFTLLPQRSQRTLAHATICAALRLGHQPCVLSEDVGGVRVLGETLLLLALRIANRLVALLLDCRELLLPQRTPRPESPTNPNSQPSAAYHNLTRPRTFLMAARAVSTCSASRACTSSVLSCSATLASTRARRSPSAYTLCNAAQTGAARRSRAASLLLASMQLARRVCAGVKS